MIGVLFGSKNKLQRKLLIYVIVVTLITALIAVPLYLVADSISGIALGIPMLIVGLFFWQTPRSYDTLGRKREKGINSRKLENLSLKDFVLIGIVQGISALPGVSRSGTTTSAMLLLDVEPDEAFRLSFVAGIFASIGAFGLTLVASKSNVSAAVAGIGLAGIIVAIIVATIVSLFLIDFLIKVAGKSKIIYLITALGIIAMASGLLYLVFRL